MSDIPRGVLSDVFHKLIDGRRLRAAAFLTFRFDPGFFEQEVLPIFLDVSLSHVPEIRLLNLAEALRQVDAVAVYYDKRGLQAGASSAKLDIQRVALARTTGYFHPKNILVLVENDPHGTAQPTQTLIVASLSANLTRAGWWENVEVAHAEELHEGEPSSLRDDVRTLIRGVRRESSGADEHPALDAIDAFLRRVPQEEQKRRDGVLLPRLFSGGSFVEFLKEIAGSRLRRCNLEVLSPYFDVTESSSGALNQLREEFSPAQVRVFLPRGFEGEALCSKGYFDEVAKVAAWGALPLDVMRLSSSAQRTLHAKVYRFFDPVREYQAFFVGSVNLTSPAFNRGGNFESGFFIENPQRRLDWWLEVDDDPPGAFAVRTEDEGTQQGSGWRLSLRYDWQSGAATALWDSTQPSPSLELLAHGIVIGEVAPLDPKTPTRLANTIAEALQRELTSGSFITVRVSGEEDVTILVDEVHMTHKPSLMSTLTANDILRYWALLTTEQKKEFLEERAEELTSDPELALWIGSERRPELADSFFATFTEIFVSFGNLEKTVKAALEQRRDREAVDRLFGRKFDSLRRLLERVFEETEADAVRSYITVLCARQLLSTLQREEPEFVARNQQDVGVLSDLLERADEIRSRFGFASEAAGRSFLDWFERWFVAKADPLETVAT